MFGFFFFSLSYPPPISPVDRSSSIVGTLITVAGSARNSFTGGWSKFKVKLAVNEEEKEIDVKHPKTLRFAVTLPREVTATLIYGREVVGKHRVRFPESMAQGFPTTLTFTFREESEIKPPTVSIRFCWFGRTEIVGHHGVRLRVHIEGCLNLAAESGSGVQLRLLHDGPHDSVMQQTTMCLGNNPTWFEMFDFTVHHRHAMLEIVIVTKSDELLGSVSLSVMDIAHGLVSNAIAIQNTDKCCELLLSAEIGDKWRDVLLG